MLEPNSVEELSVLDQVEVMLAELSVEEVMNVADVVDDIVRLVTVLLSEV